MTKTTGVDAPQNFSKQKSQDASIGKSIAAKTQKSKFRIWKEQVQQSPQIFSKRKSQDASIGKSIPAKTQKSKLRIWPKFRCREAATGKLPKNQKKTRSISPFTIVTKGVREFFREKFHDKPPTPEAELVTKNPSRRKAKTVELCKTAKTGGEVSKKTLRKKSQHFPLLH